MKLFSEEYQQELIAKHNKKGWGGAVQGKGGTINTYMELSRAKSVLDYGAGSSAFRKEIEVQFPKYKYTIHEYEPGRVELSNDPPVCDASICFDVMEHIEPEYVDNVIKHIYDKTNYWTFQDICLKASYNYFPSGKNLHLTVKPAEWWIEKLKDHWTFCNMTVTNGHLRFLGFKK